MTCTEPSARSNGHWLRLPIGFVAATMLAGCWLEEPPSPPPFDCATIDRAAERFPDECGEDAGVSLDAGP